MSIHCPDVSGHITITSPGAASIPQGGYTIGVLYKNLAFSAAFLWNAYRSDNFSNINMYVDGDIWVNFQAADSNVDLSSPTWRYYVVTKADNTATPRAHWADFTSSGALSWSHANFPGTQGDFAAMNRFSIGDEFGNGMRGDLANLVGFTSDNNDAGVEAIFGRTSSGILATTPQFFVHFPEAAGLGSSFVDLAGGGVETIRTGDWSATTDPAGYSFTLGRSGKPKTWNGSSWPQHSAKAWTGSAWVEHPMKGHDGSSFVTAK